MNELQLPSRLRDLADDLATGDDPFELVAGARALHRRRRRTRIAVAGAALAVALVAVGVPTAMDTLSAPDRGDVAAPTTSAGSEGMSEAPEGSPGAAAQLQPLVESVRADLTRPGVDGSRPDPEQARACPDASEALGRATGMYDLHPLGINAGGGTLTGCGWSTDPSGATAAENRLDLSLTAAFDATDESVRAELADRVHQDACAWTTVVEGGAFDPLLRCSGAQTTVSVTLVDEDGTGAWILTSAVGSEMPEAFGTLTSTVTALWNLVTLTTESGQSAEPEITPLNRNFNTLVNRFERRSGDLSLDAPSTTMSCPEAPAEMGAWTGVELAEVRGPERSLTCTWSTDEGPAAGLAYSIGFTAGVEALVYASEQDVDLDFSDGGDCLGVVLPRTSPAAGLASCRHSEREEWRLDIADAGGDGMWAITLSLPAGVEIQSPTAMVVLTDLADSRW